MSVVQWPLITSWSIGHVNRGWSSIKIKLYLNNITVLLCSHFFHLITIFIFVVFMIILVHVPQMTVLRNKCILLSYFSDSTYICIDINQRQIKTSAKRGPLNHVVLNGGDQSLPKNISLNFDKFLDIKSHTPLLLDLPMYIDLFYI